MVKLVLETSLFTVKPSSCSLYFIMRYRSLSYHSKSFILSRLVYFCLHLQLQRAVKFQ